MKSILQIIIAAFLLIQCSTTKIDSNSAPVSQSFEGYVIYKSSPIMPENMPADMWQKMIDERNGDDGIRISKNYYKPNNFCASVSGFESGKQVYNPKDSLHYSWVADAKSAFTIDYRKEQFIKIKRFIELDSTAIINQINCKSMKVDMSIGSMTIWFNEQFLPMDHESYQGTLFGKEVIEKIGCLPIKAEIGGMLNIEMLEYKEEALRDDVFLIPQFEQVDH